MFFQILISFLLVNGHIINTSFVPDYKTALKLSLLFYEAQRSGKLPETSRIKWRGNSALHDIGQNGEELTGGYYDASDYVKFSFTMAFTTTVLSWGMIQFSDAYNNTDEFENGIAAIKWATDYFIKCHTSKFEFYGQVGDFKLDHSYWGRPEQMTMDRPAYKIDKDHPGSELAGEVSAAFAAASILFQNINQTYSNLLVKHAEEMYEFGTTYRGLYHDAIPGAKLYYESSGYGEELCWAAVWLYKATKNVKYITEAEYFYKKFHIKSRPNEFFYHKKTAGIQLLLAEETSRTDYVNSVTDFCNFSIKEQNRTPLGLIFIDEVGTLAHAANIAFICIQAATTLNISGATYINFAKEQIDYMLGSKTNSYVVGYGTNYPKQPHNAASSCPNLPAVCNWNQFVSKSANPQILNGALVSGPDRNDHYEDIRDEFVYNEVTLDYNACFQSTIAGLIHHQIN